MDILTAEINRKRKILDKISGPHKFIKSTALEEVDDALELALPEHDNEQSLDENACTTEETSDNVKKEKEEKEIPKEEQISEEELTKRFRSLNHPVRLFGELKADRLQRLKRLESEIREHGNKNAKSYKTTSEEVDNQILHELLGVGPQRDSRVDAKEEKIRQLIEEHKDQFSKITVEYLKADKNHCYTLLYLYLKSITFQWESDLMRRDIETKQSIEGKQESALFKQTADHLKPLLKKMKKKSLDEDVEDRLAEICYWMYRKDYVRANDAYLKLSIGNACWPMGVGATGIHGREARDRIQAKNNAHVLNDETQRKWVQAVKRLVTYSQRRFPNEERAKNVG